MAERAGAETEKRKGEYASRRRSLRRLAEESGLDGLLISGLTDIRYLCGFGGSSALALLLGRSGYLLTDFRYREQCAEEVLGLRTVVCEGFGEALRNILLKTKRTSTGIAPLPHKAAVVRAKRTAARESSLPSERPRPLWRIGYDPHTMTCAELAGLRRSLRNLASLIPLREGLQRLRAVKSPAELEVMREGLRIAESAFREALRGLSGRATEWGLALELDLTSRRLGAEASSFETIVAAGSRGALVHARPSHRRLAGAVVVDWGVVHRGYCTDCTRTVAWGRVPAELKAVHRLVLEAQERAMETIRPGVRASEVDRAARDVLERAGYGAAFGHGLGHGVGMEVHERPVISPRSREVLEEGMVFTVEPGVYLPGLGGVRVEDMVLVTAQGAEVLTTLTRSMDPSDY